VRFAFGGFEITRLTLVAWPGRFHLRAQIAFLPPLTGHMGI
jgi:hypothetical protein